MGDVSGKGVSAGQGILLYTDGVTEAVNPRKQFFETDRLLDSLSGAADKAESAEETALWVSCAENAFCWGSESFDDMALIALIYRGNVLRNAARGVICL